MPAQMAVPEQFGRRGAPRASSRPHPLLLVGIALLAFAIVLVLVTHPHPATTLPAPASVPTAGDNGQRITSGDSASVEAPSTSGTQPSVAPSTSGDPLEDAARRAISREAPNVGLPPPAATSPDGVVHLRTGGSISAQEWNDARAKLKNSPLMRDPPPPPPF
jgi:hypothetical protein